MKSSLKHGMVWLAVSGLTLTAFGQDTLRIARVPADPLELVTGQVQADTPARREAVLHLLARARSSYQLRNAGQAWDLKVHFTVDSHGETNYDGAWEMEDRFVPGQGLHWTAKSAAGYSITGIFAPKATYSEATAAAIPLRLQEARSMLYSPLPSVDYAGSGSIRTFVTSFHGASVTCILLDHSRNVQNPAVGRGWEESEDCIDSQSGLLQLHSDAPGRYAVYDYSDAAQLGDRLVPRRVTVSEGGRVVSEIQVKSLDGQAAIDARLFVPTERMKAAQVPAMTSVKKISRIVTTGAASQGEGSATSAVTVRPVCVFGVVNSAGKLVEAHSLQPSDPNSQAAVKDARAINFSAMVPAGAAPQQHFVFVIEKFISPE
jgi:hypothetical protein